MIETFSQPGFHLATGDRKTVLGNFKQYSSQVVKLYLLRQVDHLIIRSVAHIKRVMLDILKLPVTFKCISVVMQS